MLTLAFAMIGAAFGQVQKTNLDFSQATPDPETGALCVMQEVCIADVSALASLLPPGPCIPNVSEMKSFKNNKWHVDIS